MNGRKRFSWEETALRLAFDIANYRSEDCYVQVGACIIKNDLSFVLAYNGPPIGVDIDWSDRDKRRPKILHAESNACSFVNRGEGRFIAVTALPCKECIKLIAQKQIFLVIYPKGSELSGYENELSKELAKEFKIQLKEIDFSL
ncbi:MAG: hypothetical protein Q8P06_00420 [Candidatus Azambacteria bacterium]|nr:hypothetical protein [Candidatus Azambacteria bacterium]